MEKVPTPGSREQKEHSRQRIAFGPGPAEGGEVSEIKIVTSWDELPPVVNDQGQWYSTRVMEKQYRDALSQVEQVRAALERCKSNHGRYGEFVWGAAEADNQLRLDIEAILGGER